MTPDELRSRLTITVDEAAAALGIGRTAAYDACRRGELPAVRLGRRLLVPTAPLLELLGAAGGDPAEDPADAGQERPRTGPFGADPDRTAHDQHSGAQVVELR